MKRFVVLFTALSFAAASAWAAAPAKKSKEKEEDKPAAAEQGFFKPEASTSSGSITVEGRRVDYQAVAGTLVVHPKGWDDAAKPAGGDDGDKAKSDDKNPDAEASMFYVAYFKRGAPSAVASRHLPVQWRSRLLDGVAPYGRVRSAPRRHRRRLAHPRCALSRRRQCLQPARRQRPRLHRCAGHGLQPHRRQGQGKRVSTASIPTPTPSPVREGFPHQIWPLEFAEISLRRKLRHAARVADGRPSSKARTPST